MSRQDVGPIKLSRFCPIWFCRHSIVSTENQYRVWLPFAWITARHLRGMEAIRCWIVCLGMIFQSSCSTANSSSGVAGGTFRTPRRRSSSSHKCSIGLRSGLSDGQGRVRVLIVEVGHSDAGCVRSGIILLEHSSWSAQWQDMRLQDFLDVLCRC